MQRFTNTVPVTVEELEARVQEQRDREFTQQNLRQRLQEPLDLADKIEAGTATAAEQRRALVLALRLSVRLARYELGQLDQADN